MEGTLVQTAQLLALNDFVGGTLATSKVGLYKNDVFPTKDTVMADLEQVAQSGMVPLACAWGVPIINPDGKVASVGAGLIFTPDGPVGTPFVVYGWFVSNTSVTALYAVHRFETPIPVDNGDVGIPVQPMLTPFDDAA